MRLPLPVLMLGIALFGLSGCQKTIAIEEIYEFPEPTMQIQVSLLAQGEEQTFVIGPEPYDPTDPSVSSALSWFSQMQLQQCKAPEPAEGDMSYTFCPDGREALIYIERGSEAFLVVEDNWYQVLHPSAPSFLLEETSGIEETKSQVAFGGRWVDEAALSEETLQWLAWYNSLPEEEQLAISAIPADLLEEAGITATEDAAAAD